MSEHNIYLFNVKNSFDNETLAFYLRLQSEGWPESLVNPMIYECYHYLRSELLPVLSLYEGWPESELLIVLSLSSVRLRSELLAVLSLSDGWPESECKMPGAVLDLTPILSLHSAANLTH